MKYNLSLNTIYLDWLVALFVFSLAPLAFSDQSPREKAQLAAKSFAEAGKHCPGRVWPNYKAYAEGARVVFVDPPTKQAWVWNTPGTSDQDDSILAIRISDIQVDSDFFEDFEFTDPDKTDPNISPDNINSKMILNISSLSDEVFSIGFHEAFHHYVQEPHGWPATSNFTDMAAIYPASAEPTYYRAQLVSELQAAYIDAHNRADHLSAAAYWQNKFKSFAFKKSGDEYKRNISIDIAEGSASYVEAVGNALAQLGCEASDSDIRDFFVNNPSHLGLGGDMRWETDLREQSYLIGHLAGLILRDQDKQGWEQKIVQGATPVDVLLTNVVESKELANKFANPRIRSAVESVIQRENIRNKEHIDSTLVRLSSPEYIKLSMSENYMVGSSENFGYINPFQDLPESVIAIQATARFKTNMIDYALNKESYLIQPRNACGINQVVLLVPADKFIWGHPDNNSWFCAK